MVAPGRASEITVYGRNLPGGKLDPNIVVDGQALEKITVTVTAPKDVGAAQRLAFNGHSPPGIATLDGFEYWVEQGEHASNSVLLTYARAPVILEQGSHNSAESAQVVHVPCEIAGRAGKSGQRDWYAFPAKKGDVYIIEAFSHRLGAPTDLYMTVRNATGKQAVDVVQLDDNPETLNPGQFATANRDPAPYRFVAPADGLYQLVVGSHLSAGGGDVRNVYKIRIAPERPDFRLIVMPGDTYRPDSCTLAGGGNQDLTVFVLRQDGFKGEVALAVDGLPPGVTYKPQVVGPGLKQGALVLNASLDAKPWAGTLTVTGTAQINGKTVVREARPASITWQVPQGGGIPSITRLERSLVLAVRDKAPYTLTCGFDTAAVIHGNKVTIPLKVTRHRADIKGPVQVQAVPQEMPQGVNFPNVTLPADKNEQNLVLNVPGNVPPGHYTFVFRSFAPIPVGPKKQVNTVQCSTAVVLTVVPKQVATLTVSNNAPTLKPGTEMELVVKVARQFDFQDSFKVKLVLPPKTEGISADEVTIPAGKNEAKLILRAAEDAEPGPRNNLIFQATATVSGLTLTQETKINVKVLE